MRVSHAISSCIITVLLAATPVTRAQAPPATQDVKEVRMTARKYEFSPSTVEVNAGTKIIFKITALDREHGFEIAGVKDSCVTIKKGETATVEYVAKQPGTVEFKCCEFCGVGHGRMKGKIIVH